MRCIIKSYSRTIGFLTTVVFSLSLVIGMVPSAWAAQLQNRSLSLSSVKASDINSYALSFNFPSTNNVGSLVLEFCSNSPLEDLVCTAPTGLDVSTASLIAQSGETGFSILLQTANTIILTRPSAATGTGANSYTFSGIRNPSTIGPFYLRIHSYASVDGSGSETDFGATVADITQGVTITTEVPQILEFCVGASIPAQCNSASGDFLDLGNFHTNSTAAGITQFMVGTNAQFGYVVTANGNTMTSGNNAIQAMASPTASVAGTSQFGINLRANSNPAVGADPSGGSGVPTPNFNSPDLFMFANGAAIAGHTFTSRLEKYTVSYIVNIDPAQPVGIYNTTITYVVTSTF